MAIRFTPEYNARINKIVRDYNKRVRRANKEGKLRKSNLPETVSARVLKKSYSSRTDLDRELKTLEMFNRKMARQPVGEHLTEYDIATIKVNREATIEHFEKIADIVRGKVKKNLPLQQGRLDTIELNIKNLKQDVDTASESDKRAMLAYVNKYRKSFERQANGYRGFLSEVDMVMDRVGVPKEQKDAFFKKMSQLNSEEFYELYEKSDLVSKVYELADSPKYTGGKLVLYDTEQNAKDLIDTLLQEADMLIAEVKS
jgi:hypothetical protein